MNMVNRKLCIDDEKWKEALEWNEKMKNFENDLGVLSGTSSFKVLKDGSAFKDKEPYQQSFEIVKTEDEDFNTTPNIPPQHPAMDISTPAMLAATIIDKKIKELVENSHFYLYTGLKKNFLYSLHWRVRLNISITIMPNGQI
ncbi:hypothetical protein QVD17_06569 [Tagetes erecta]|uniref:Uncharacterized protein n=1 Tax=Tagetes erecta TaxID=13708 RepID=A0AAD8LJL8_TARER|nr:hypothetical protein QVD17_06569 [Tagetes erecta]